MKFMLLAMHPCEASFLNGVILFQRIVKLFGWSVVHTRQAKNTGNKIKPTFENYVCGITPNEQELDESIEFGEFGLAEIDV